MKQPEKGRRWLRSAADTLWAMMAVGGWTLFGPRSWAMDEVTREALESLTHAGPPRRGGGGEPPAAAAGDLPVVAGCGCCAS